MSAQPSELSARLIDIFGSPATADPTKLYGNFTVTPNGNILVGTATESTTATKLQVAGGIVVNSYDANNQSHLRMIQGNYGAMFRSDGTNFFLISTPSGGQYGTWNTYRPITYNLTNGSLNLVGDGSVLTINGNTWFSSTGTLSPSIYLNANGYAPYIRANSSNGSIEIINSANTAVNATIYDSGVVNFRSRPSWAGVTPYDTGNLNIGAYMPTSGGGFSGPVSSSAYLGPIGSSANPGVNQGTYISWNDGGGDGSVYVTCNKGGGGGGHVLRTVNVNNTIEYGRFVITAAGAGSQGSDERLKENIEPLTDSLSKIRSIRGVSYAYKSNGEKHYGVIAQEVQSVFPYCVTDNHGSVPDTDGETYLGVSYSDLVAPLIEAVKELANKVDFQASMIASLQAQLASKQ